MKIRPLLLLVLLITAAPLHANVHPVDKYLTACIERDSTTAGMVDCTNAAYELWDKALNKQYAALLSVLSASDKQTLREAQRQWLVFRDAEFKAIDALYSRKDGSVYLPMRAADRLDLVKARALKLSAYVALMKD